MKIVFTELAKLELEDAAEYYELKQSHLGQEFKNEIKLTVLRIRQYPQAWGIAKGDVRKCLLHRFPYKILYSIEEDHLLIIAIAHQHRKPDYWIGTHYK